MNKTATEIIDEVREEMCDRYCKYAAKARDWLEANEYEEIIPEECDTCPLNRL